jgi:GTPase involved in cell partitioning and DNA repair
VREELRKFNPLLTEKPEIILLTKSDLLAKDELEKKRKILQRYGKVFPISILEDKSLKKLEKLLRMNPARG